MISLSMYQWCSSLAHGEYLQLYGIIQYAYQYLSGAHSKYCQLHGITPQWCPSLAHSESWELKVSTDCAYQHRASVIPITLYSMHSLNLCAYQRLSGTHHLPVESTVNSMVSVMANNRWYVSLRCDQQISGANHLFTVSIISSMLSLI